MTGSGINYISDRKAHIADNVILVHRSEQQCSPPSIYLRTRVSCRPWSQDSSEGGCKQPDVQCVKVARELMSLVSVTHSVRHLYDQSQDRCIHAQFARAYHHSAQCCSLNWKSDFLFVNLTILSTLSYCCALDESMMHPVWTLARLAQFLQNCVHVKK